MISRYDERQMHTVLNLSIAPSNGIVTLFEVSEPWSNGAIWVRRQYKSADSSVIYSECVVVGPRGRVTRKSFYII